MHAACSAQQVLAQLFAKIVHGEHHQLTHTNKTRRLAARDRVRDQQNEAAFQIERAQCLYGPSFHAGVEV